MTTAEEFKAAGNAALKGGKISEAIANYTKAINVDGANHVYFSNRSAAYLKQGNGNNALDDANSCIALNPQFAKGYSRKGAALHHLKRYNDSIAAYNEGLEKFPTDAGLKKGLEDVKREKDLPPMGAGGPPGGGLFSPSMLAQMSMDPRFKKYLEDPSIMGKIKMIQQNPNLMPTMLSDPKMMEMLQLLMGEQAGATSQAPAPAPSPKPAKKEEPKKPVEVEEDWSNLSTEEREKKETQNKARLKKEEGNALYKSKKFTEALAAYDEAFVIDPTSMTFLLNKAAVYFAQKKYDECIAECNKSLEVGKENMAPFEDRAKALTRCAKAYQKKKDLAMAIEMCKSAQLESYSKDTQRLLKSMELEKKKKDKLDYQDEGKAQEAKQRGNDFFREKKFPEAIKEYEEAVKRAPNDAPIRNNLSAALTKIMDFNGAKTQVEKALELDPLYTKAWGRKGDIEMAFK